MSKEFDQIKQAVNNRKNELDTQKRFDELIEREKNERLNIEWEKKEKEGERIKVENRKVLEDSGVVKLFEEIRDSGLVKKGDKPLYEDQPAYRETLFGGRKFVGNKRVKVCEYTPAEIVWSSDCSAISLLFNEDSYYDGMGDPECPCSVPIYNFCTFGLNADKKMGFCADNFKSIHSDKSGCLGYGSNLIEIEKKDIPDHIAEVLSKHLK